MSSRHHKAHGAEQEPQTPEASDIQEMRKYQHALVEKAKREERHRVSTGISDELPDSARKVLQGRIFYR